MKTKHILIIAGVILVGVVMYFIGSSQSAPADSSSLSVSRQESSSDQIRQTEDSESKTDTQEDPSEEQDFDLETLQNLACEFITAYQTVDIKEHRDTSMQKHYEQYASFLSLEAQKKFQPNLEEPEPIDYTYQQSVLDSHAFVTVHNRDYSAVVFAIIASKYEDHEPDYQTQLFHIKLIQEEGIWKVNDVSDGAAFPDGFSPDQFFS